MFIITLELRNLPATYRRTIEEIKNILMDIKFIDGVYVFGSVARGTIHVGSDIDLLIIIKDEIDLKNARRTLLLDLADISTDIEVDLLIKSKSSIDLSDNFTSKVMKEKIQI